MDMGGEGFNRDYLANMPIADKEAINFNDFDPDGSAQFSFEKLLRIYAENLADSALVDITHEIEHDIFETLLIEMGLQISADKDYSPDNPLYISKEDFDLAKSMGEGLRGLRKAKIKKLPKEEEEKTEDDEKKESKWSQEDIDGNRKLLEGILEDIEDAEKIKAKKKDGEDEPSKKTKKRIG